MVFISMLIEPHLKKIEDIIIKLLIARSFVYLDDTIRNEANIYFERNKLKKKDEEEILYLLYKWNLHKKKILILKYFSGRDILKVLRMKIVMIENIYVEDSICNNKNVKEIIKKIKAKNIIKCQSYKEIFNLKKQNFVLQKKIHQ